MGFLIIIFISYVNIITWAYRHLDTKKKKKLTSLYKMFYVYARACVWMDGMWLKSHLLLIVRPIKFYDEYLHALLQLT